MQAFDQEFCNLIQPKLDALEQIRGDLGKENVSVPCIAVVGDQSAGKSSVMEYVAAPWPAAWAASGVPRRAIFSASAYCSATVAEYRNQR